MSEAVSRERYPVEVHRLGGRDKDGSPAFLGRWTFDTHEVRAVVEDALTGDVLNATAGKTRLRHGGGDIHRNDINPDIPADSRRDVTCIDEHFAPDSFDTAILDPPFDAGQAEKRYEGFRADDITAAREALANLVAPGGRLIEFGWSSHGAAAYHGWAREELHIFQRGPCLPDVFGTVDKRYQTTLGD
jgi:hypothetical protein